MKTWRTVSLAIAALSLATAIGCNADTAKDEDNRPEPAVQDGGSQNNADEDALSNDPQSEDEAGAGNGQNAEPSTDAGGSNAGNSGDQPADLPADQPEEPAMDGEAGDEGTVTILPAIEPDPEMEFQPAVPEPVSDGPIRTEGGISDGAGSIDPNTPVSKNAAP